MHKTNAEDEAKYFIKLCVLLIKTRCRCQIEYTIYRRNMTSIAENSQCRKNKNKNPDRKRMKWSTLAEQPHIFATLFHGEAPIRHEQFQLFFELNSTTAFVLLNAACLTWNKPLRKTSNIVSATISEQNVLWLAKLIRLISKEWNSTQHTLIARRNWFWLNWHQPDNVKKQQADQENETRHATRQHCAQLHSICFAIKCIEANV